MGGLVLDFLLVIIFLMMVPIGFYRGGMREMCVSGGLLLGILLSQEWGERWSTLFERLFGMTASSATFLMSVVIAFGVTALIGYGGSAAFSWRPGPGGRIYGAYLALLNSMIATGYLINLYGDYIVPVSNEKPITSGIVARTLSDGFGSVLLAATIGIGIATIFGMFVRERAEETPAWSAPAPQLYQPPSGTKPYRVEEAPVEERLIGPPVRILETTSWEDKAEPSRPDPKTYGTGWRQTWPEGGPASTRDAKSPKRTPTTTEPARRKDDSSSSKSVLADWIKDQDES